MQVSVETTTELSRKMTVQVSEEKIQEKVKVRLNSLARDARFDGFRPGKVPHSVIKKRFGPKVREEVLSDLIQTTFQDALRDERLRPVGAPHIHVSKADEGEGLEYEAKFEVFPEFVPMPLEALEVKRYVSEVTGDDVDNMLQRLRQQRGTWNEVARPAAVGDQVLISFEGHMDGESFTNGKNENFPLVLGSQTMIPGFEDRLIGTEAGARLEFEMAFPSWYPNPKFAEKTGQFSVEVLKVQESMLPEIDDEFVKGFGVEEGGVDAFRVDVRANMQRTMEQALRTRNKTSVMDALYARNMLALPTALVEDELKDLIAAYQKSADKGRPLPDEATLRAQYTPLARRRVALAIIINKLVDAYHLKVDPNRVRSTIEEFAASYQEAEAVVRWHYAEPGRLREIENLVMEEQLVELVFGKAQVTEENISFQILTQPVTGTPVSA